ncbi:S8 family serine peptidase [Mangrovimonas sp. TPBH4]|uniref:S8 family serine peptidase n=1 Tax=Mangrovimonas sp. TPBH4 TaxID=1645914 RepID=UPI0006B4B4B7|nr:S8 family serine peptidase [Mangrovimonas sp. TPBH4]
MLKKILLFGILAIGYLGHAQEDAWVYLTDKLDVEASINNPISILSQAAIDRKNAHGIPIDNRDVPVNEAYISTLKTQIGITVLAKSKWFNAVHVRGAQTDISALLDLPFVDSIDFADNSLDLSSGKMAALQNKFSLEETTADFVYGNAQNQVEMLNLETLHQLDFTGEGIVIAVLDAGFPNVNTMAGFQRLRDNDDLLDGYDFVNRTEDVYTYSDNDHGTRVLSTMAGYVEDQFVGTAPDASYYLFRTEDAGSENPVEESYWVEAAERADSLGVHIINSSLGYNEYDNPNYSYTTADMNGNTAFISKGANIAFEKGILVVSSAGNSGATAWQIVGAPADAANVLSVGAVDSEGNYAAFSSQGNETQPTQKPDVVAQGAGASIISPSDALVSNSGTSFSGPIIAGAAASLWQAFPLETNAEIKQRIQSSSSQYDSPDNLLGFGIPDFGLAYDMLLSLHEMSLDEIHLYPNPIREELTIQMGTLYEETTYSLCNLQGKELQSGTLTKSVEDISFSGLAQGMYVFSLKTKTQIKSVKLIKL